MPWRWRGGSGCLPRTVVSCSLAECVSLGAYTTLHPLVPLCAPEWWKRHPPVARPWLLCSVPARRGAARRVDLGTLDRDGLQVLWTVTSVSGTEVGGVFFFFSNVLAYSTCNGSGEDMCLGWMRVVAVANQVACFPLPFPLWRAVRGSSVLPPLSSPSLFPSKPVHASRARPAVLISEVPLPAACVSTNLL